MPWTEKDVKRHKKGLSTSQKKKWAKIANAVLDKSHDEVLAIKVANSRTKRMNESVDIIIDNYLEEKQETLGDVTERTLKTAKKNCEKNLNLKNSDVKHKSCIKNEIKKISHKKSKSFYKNCMQKYKDKNMCGSRSAFEKQIHLNALKRV